MKPLFALACALSLSACSSGPSFPGGAFAHRSMGTEWRLEDRPGGAFAVTVRRTLGVGFHSTAALEQGCRRDAVRIALEEAHRRKLPRPEVDERLVASSSGVLSGPFYWCLATASPTPL